jgi:hypothetical protein
LKQKAFTIAFLVLIGTALLFTSTSTVTFGQSPYGVYIFQVSQQGNYVSIQNGTVGQSVTLSGSVNTAEGSYRVYFNNVLVNSGNAEGYYVSANFTLPEVTGGDYTLVLMDVTQGVNATYPFPILTAYSAKAIAPTSPAQLLEGNNVVLNVTVTGGEASTAYAAEITVRSPAPISTNYTKLVSFTSSSLGTAQAQITFPDSSFSPSGSSTLYAGAYAVFFNESQALVQDSFSVGFTDLTQYHRQDTVRINAPGYQPSQSATVAIQFNNVVVSSQTVTASSQGVITATWIVPSDVAIGSYTVTISPQTTPSKAVGDVQTFGILGYPISFNTLNLADESVPQILLEVLDQATNTYSNGTTFADGNVVLNLEKGTHTVNAYWNEVKVGQTQVTISGNHTYTVACKLTDLKIKVEDKNGVAIPFVNLNMTYQYVTRAGTTLTGNASGQTDLSGVYAFNSTLTGISYSVVASKYDTSFNAGNNTISNVPEQASLQAMILCPDKTLTLKTVDYNFTVLPNARVILIEQASGIFYSVTTDNTGTAQVQVTFGQYRADVYTSGNVLLNETIVNALSNTLTQIRCVIYKLPVSIKIVDYFGNGISNVNVQLSRPSMGPLSATTQGDGTVTFNEVIGGNVEITAYLSEDQSSYVASNVQVDSPTTLVLTMNKYVVLGGAVMETSTLATLILVIIAILLFIVIEVYRRTGFKFPRKNEI